VGCASCHAAVREAGDDDPVTAPDDATCVECHAPPHDPRPCLDCHGDPADIDRARMARRYLRFAHREHLGRLKGNCARCHVDVAEPGQALLPSMPTCLGCHEDAFQVGRCDRCHQDLEAEGARPESHLVHGVDFVREHGVKASTAPELCRACHRESDCAGCHGRTVPALPARRTFDAPDVAGLHRAGFAARHAEEARAQPGLCVTCHAVSSCESCHTAQGLTPSASLRLDPHPPGWTSIVAGESLHGRAARRDPASCASCHGGTGEQLCVDCHRVGGVGGTVHPPGWRSNLDPRADHPCRLCHGPLP
jgi:hypothetical protein